MNICSLIIHAKTDYTGFHLHWTKEIRSDILLIRWQVSKLIAVVELITSWKINVPVVPVMIVLLAIGLLTVFLIDYILLKSFIIETNSCSDMFVGT